MQKLNQSIEEEYGKLMQLYIAHRFSTIQHVDKIYVIKDGSICEEGRYDELIEEEGEFYKIYLTQKLEEEE